MRAPFRASLSVHVNWCVLGPTQERLSANQWAAHWCIVHEELHLNPKMAAESSSLSSVSSDPQVCTVELPFLLFQMLVLFSCFGSVSISFVVVGPFPCGVQSPLDLHGSPDVTFLAEKYFCSAHLGAVINLNTHRQQLLLKNWKVITDRRHD